MERRYRGPRTSHPALDRCRPAGLDAVTHAPQISELTGISDEYRLLAESSTEKVTRTDLDGKVLYVSRGVGRFGYQPGEWVGRRVEEFVHPDDAARVHADIARLREEPAPRVVRHRLRHRDGSYRWVETIIRGVLDEGGRSRETLAFTRDVTDEVRAQQELRETAHTLKVLADNATDVIVVAGEDDRVRYISESAREVLGYEPAHLLGDRLPEIFHPDDRAGLREIVDLLRSGADRQTGQLRVRRADGRWIWTEITTRAARDEDGRLELHGSIRDITDRKQVEEQLRASNAELAQFAYAASHDLQEPLRVIAMAAEMLERGYGERLDDDGRELTGTVLGSARRMSQLLDDLLRLARAGSEPLALEPVPLGEVLDAACANLQVAFGDAGGRVEVEEPLPVVYADRASLLVVLQNLIANAVKFRGDEPPVVHVAARREADRWRIVVADNGIGISPDHAERIFGVFQRLHRPEEYPGTGVGLALCRRIVERLGGELTVRSEPGRGSEFSFTLPAYPDAAREEPGR